MSPEIKANWNDFISKEIDSIIDSQDFSQQATPLKNEEAIKLSYKEELLNFFNYENLTKGMRNAIDLILNQLHLVAPVEECVKAQEDLARSAQKYVEYIRKLSEEGTAEKKGSNGTIFKPDEGQIIIYQQVFGISNDTMNSVYDLALHYYVEEETMNARDLLNFLLNLAPDISSYWVGVGLCWQQEKRFEQAVHFYEMAKVMNEQNPAGFLYAAECYHEMHQAGLAIENLQFSERLVMASDFRKEEWGPVYEKIRNKIKQEAHA